MKRLLPFLMLAFAIPALAQKWAKQYDFVDQCICGLSLVGKDNKVGYVDNGGNIIIPLNYDEGLSFNEGFAAVRSGKSWMYFDSTGKKVNDETFADAQSFHDGLAAVMKNGRYGYINTKGKTVIGFQFNNARSFADGLAPVSNDRGLWGYISTNGNYVITPEYSFADSFENDEARVIKGNNVFYIDKNNKKLHD